MSAGTQVERLSRIEALIERSDQDRSRENARLEKKIDDVIAAQRADEKDLAALKNKGAGILIGVGVVAGIIGAKFSALWSAFADAFR